MDIQSPRDACTRPGKLIVLSNEGLAGIAELEEFLSNNLYRHECLQKANSRVAQWMKDVFEKFCKNSKLIPQYYQRLIADEGLERTVCDYIAGMTDRYCLSMLDEI